MIMFVKWLVIFFGIFLIVAGFIMFFVPEKAREILRKAGSTNFINYTEITIRMIPAAAMILYSEFSKYPEFFKFLGGFMIITSLVMYFVPRQMHHGYSQKCAEILNPIYFRLLSPISIFFGLFLIYCVV